MKPALRLSAILFLIALFLTSGCNQKKNLDPNSAVRSAGARTFSSFDPPAPDEKTLATKAVKFVEADLDTVLNFYAEISGRSVIRGANLPNARITFSNQTPMSQVEVLQALDTVLAAQGVVMVLLGTQYVKALHPKDVTSESGPVVELRPAQLPDSSSFLVYVVKLKNVKPAQAVAALSPFSKLPNSIIGINGESSGRPAPAGALPNLPAMFGGKDQSVLILRDYSSNVRRMLEVLEKMEGP